MICQHIQTKIRKLCFSGESKYVMVSEWFLLALCEYFNSTHLKNSNTYVASFRRFVLVLLSLPLRVVFSVSLSATCGKKLYYTIPECPVRSSPGSLYQTNKSPSGHSVLAVHLTFCFRGHLVQLHHFVQSREQTFIS